VCLLQQDPILGPPDWNEVMTSTAIDFEQLLPSKEDLERLIDSMNDDDPPVVVKADPAANPVLALVNGAPVESVEKIAPGPDDKELSTSPPGQMKKGPSLQRESLAALKAEGDAEELEVDKKLREEKRLNDESLKTASETSTMLGIHGEAPRDSSMGLIGGEHAATDGGDNGVATGVLVTVK
jgi:hypothetical protein